MTEKRYCSNSEKRYDFVQDSLVKADVFDNETGKFICCTLSVWAEQLVDLLNTQHETITEQTIQLDFLQDENQHMRTVLEENRRLKQTLKDLGIEVI